MARSEKRGSTKDGKDTRRKGKGESRDSSKDSDNKSAVQIKNLRKQISINEVDDVGVDFKMKNS
jgi:hypothetical protein